ncbi:threonylcarbamoyl-AMP synthase [bacterium]|nr:threonylcarbamoyl-AMP synthase [bacterium]
MKIITNQTLDFAEISEVLNNDGVIIYPTETVYGIGCAFTSQKAKQKIYKIKKRDTNLPLSVIVDSVLMLENLEVKSSGFAKFLLKNCFPAPLTLVFEFGETSLGARIPASDFCLKLLKEFGKPIFSTSVNFSKSGKKDPSSVSEIEKEILEQVDLVIDFGKLKESLPSTVLDTQKNELKILREGAFPKTKLEKLYEEFLTK